ncbi:uncharacterized protein LOC112049791 [Bicyclus anynana]|uniref:Uncharacterized protein LOC112049791 n=1 Tax=Bicyclus anynana TaxID=110368 RepID=A0ABM3LV31_BICAN|nr:uncharacterized protein LOC112049791 [Bicyclus anynana]
MEEDYIALNKLGDESNLADEEVSHEVDKLNDFQFQVEDMVQEKEGGDDVDLFGTNPHYNIPVNYQDFGRRFVLTYPYVEQYLVTKNITDKELKPVKEYWDDVWKEDVDVKKMLRYGNERNKLGSVTVKISPGSKLHELISILKQRSPRFLYVINKSTERYIDLL